MARKDMMRIIGGICLLAVFLYLMLSLATHSEFDPPNRGYHQEPQTQVGVNNLGGIVGAYISRGMFRSFGLASYLIAFAAGCFGVLLIYNHQGKGGWPARLSATALLVIAVATLLHVMFTENPVPDDADNGLIVITNGGEMRGGIIGMFIGDFLLTRFGRAGAYLILCVGALIGALVSTEMMIYHFLRNAAIGLMARISEKRRERSVLKAEKTAPQGEPKLRASTGKKKSASKADKKKAASKAAQAAASSKTEPQDDLFDDVEDVAVEESPAPKPKKAEKPKSKPAKKSVAKKSDSGSSKGKPEQRTLEPVVAVTPVDGTQFKLPPVEILDYYEEVGDVETDEQLREKAEVLERTLADFGIEAQVVEIDRGPVVTLFELDLAAGIKITKVSGLSGDIARALKAPSVRIVAPIPGKSTIGVEVPNRQRQVVRLRELLDSGLLERKKMLAPLLLGKDSSGEPLLADLTQMPHLLIAGSTGSGKSVCINSLLCSLLMTQYPDNMKLVLVDPKMVELAPYEGIPHLMCPVLTDMKRAASVLEWACARMDERYEILSMVGARNIAVYNRLGEAGLRERLKAEDDAMLDDIPIHMPIIVIIIDELADLMMTAAKDAELAITRLAQKSRAVGIHIIMATQRPSVDVITGLIKANMPCRIAFQTSSMVDSRTILDRNGAEGLLGAGDMLFLPPGTSKLVRSQGSYTSDREIKDITDFWRAQGKPEYHKELVQEKPVADSTPSEREPLYDRAVEIVVTSQRGSVSLLQRKLGIGYSRAARLIDIMAENGVVGGYKGSQAREVLLTPEEFDTHWRRGGSDEEAQPSDEE